MNLRRAAATNLHDMRVFEIVSCLVLIAAGQWICPRARACSFPALTLHEVDLAQVEVDTTPPGPVVVDAVEIIRGKGPDCNAFGACQATSCDDAGQVVLEFAAPRDDRAEPEQLGYLFEHVDGTMPEDFALPAMPVRRDRPPSMRLVWGDGASDDQEAFDFGITIRAVDLAGNVGPVSEVIRVQDSGSMHSGCRSSSRASGPFAWAILVISGGVMALRRRR